MLVGAAIGQQQDQACYQMAMRAAFEQAEAERRAYEAEMARMAQAQAAARQIEESRPVVQYKAVAWRSRGTGNGGTITPTNNFTDQATGRIAGPSRIAQSRRMAPKRPTGYATRVHGCGWHRCARQLIQRATRTRRSRRLAVRVCLRGLDRERVHGAAPGWLG